MENTDGADAGPSKMNKRKKGRILHNIREQMEFYFSDSNLMKDKYLYDRLAESTDGFLDLTLFLKFKKIHALTDDVQDIVEALSSSELLEVSPDGKSLHRVKPIERTNFDECTIYIEKLPSHANHKWLRDVFSRFGNITYTSLPQFKTSKKIKGFAFVEFCSPECAIKACEAYKTNDETDELQSDDESDDAKGKSSGKLEEALQFSKDSPLQKSSKKRKQSGGDESEKGNVGFKSVKCEDIRNTFKKQTVSNDPDEQLLQSLQCTSELENFKVDQEMMDKVFSVKGDRKRRRQDGDCEIFIKKPKEEQSLIEENVVTSSQEHVDISSHDYMKDNSECETEMKSELEQTVLCKISINQQTSAEQTSNSDGNRQITKAHKSDMLVNPTPNPKKKRKRKKKSKTEEEKIQLRVISKAEWKSYRNKYLSLQRATMSRIKKILCHDHQPTSTTFEENAAVLNDDKGGNINFHDKESSIQEQETALNHKSGIEYQPGVIVKLTLSEPVTTCVSFKKQVRSLADVCYVDAVDGKSDVFVRCSNPAVASDIIQEEKFKVLGSSEILQGEQEATYWDKLQNDRAVKFGSVRQKKRGRDKIISKTEKLLAKKNTHVRFNE